MTNKTNIDSLEELIEYIETGNTPLAIAEKSNHNGKVFMIILKRKDSKAMRVRNIHAKEYSVSDRYDLF